MLAGITITADMVIAGGTFVLVVLVLQVLMGARVIKLKGRLHFKVHTWLGYALVALGIGHGVAALIFFGRI